MTKLLHSYLLSVYLQIRLLTAFALYDILLQFVLILLPISASSSVLTLVYNCCKCAVIFVFVRVVLNKGSWKSNCTYIIQSGSLCSRSAFLETTIKHFVDSDCTFQLTQGNSMANIKTPSSGPLVADVINIDDSITPDRVAIPNEIPTMRNP